jgi:hypothetical protein
MTMTELPGTTLHQNLEMVERHMKAEFTNDISKILDTISAGCRYVLFDRHDGGATLRAVTDREDVRQYYQDLRKSVDIVVSRQTRRIVTDWYVMHQSVATVRPVATISGIKPTGREYRVESALLFPVAADGIIGEIPLNRYTWSELVRGAPDDISTGASPGERDLASLTLHESYLNALRESDLKALDEICTPEFALGTRNYFGDDRQPMTAIQGLANCRAHFEDISSTIDIQNVVVTVRFATPWYVFAETAWSLQERSGGRPIDLTTANLFSVSPEGRLRAQLGYGVFS